MNKRLLQLLALCVVATCLAAPAQADPIGLLAQTGIISGRQSFVYQLQVTTPGTMTVQLADLNWQGRLSDLTFSLSNADGLLGEMRGGRVSPNSASPGAVLSSSVQMFEVTSPGTYYAYLSATATGPYGLGLFSLNATLAPAVPLPAAIWLLLAGLGSVWSVARRRGAGAVDSVAVGLRRLLGAHAGAAWAGH